MARDELHANGTPTERHSARTALSGTEKHLADDDVTRPNAPFGDEPDEPHVGLLRVVNPGVRVDEDHSGRTSVDENAHEATTAVGRHEIRGAIAVEVDRGEQCRERACRVLER